MQRFLATLLCIFTFLPSALAQREKDPEQGNKIKESYSLLGFAAKYEGVSLSTPETLIDNAELLTGVQIFYKHDAWFGTGGHLLFSQRDNALEVGIDGRYFLPLPFVEPYLGGNLNYSTRDAGGFSLALRPGVHIQASPFAKIDFYLLGRFDIFEQAFSSVEQKDVIHIGLGAGILYQF